MSTKANLLELYRIPSEEILVDTDQGSVFAYYDLPNGITPDPAALYAPGRDGLVRYEGNLSDLPGLSTECNATPVTPDPVPPVWNNTLTLPGYTGDELYEQQIPFSALTPASGKTIVGIVVVYLPEYIELLPGGDDYVYLRGTIPAGSGTAAFTLRGIQSDGLTADKGFCLPAIATGTPAPFWIPSFRLYGFTAGSFYAQSLPLSALIAASGQIIVDIDKVSLPDYLFIGGIDSASLFLLGTIPEDTTSVDIVLYGEQTDGQRTNKAFTLLPLAPAPYWNGSFNPTATIYRGAFYERQIPFSALTPGDGESIVGITGTDLPDYLAIEPGGDDYVYLRGTIPIDANALYPILHGVQSDGQTAAATWQLLPIPEPPIWNGSFVLPNFTAGAFYEQQIPFTALTPGTGETITDITGPELPSFLAIEPGGDDYVYLRGTIPTGSSDISFYLIGFQSDGLNTGGYPFTIHPGTVTTPPPTWNNSLTFPTFAPDQFYSQQIPFTALTAASGKAITNIVAGYLPDFLTLQAGGTGYKILSGTIPAGAGRAVFRLQGVQSDGQTADKGFTINPNPPINPPVWNNTLTLPGYYGNQLYEQALPLSALNPASGQTITGITGVDLPGYLSVQTISGVRYLRGTIPAGTGSLTIQLRGVQSDGQTVDKGFVLYELPVAYTPLPVWNNSLSPASFTPGQIYSQQLPFSSLDAASGKTITNITGVDLPEYLTIQTGGTGFKILTGTIPSGTTVVNFTLQGVQSDAQTANKSFVIRPVPAPPVWNNTLVLANYTPGQAFEQQIPFSALSPSNGLSITNITGLYLPGYLSIQTDNGNKYLRGTVPAGSGSLTFVLRGTQSDGLTADKQFVLYPVPINPPVWNNTYTPPSFTAGQYYEQPVPISALTPATGKTITNITAVALPDYMQLLEASGIFRWYLRGIIPAGTTSIAIELRGVQSDGATADKSFTVYPAPVPPVWNNSLVPASFTPGQAYSQQLPLSALTPSLGKSITNIVGVGLPSYLTIQTDGSGNKILSGTIPSGTTSVNFTLQGVQSDAQTADKLFTISPVVAQPPVWNDTLTLPGYTPGAYYNQALPFTALTAASGKSITNITASGLPSFLSVQVENGNRYLRGTIPAGSGNLSFILKGVQSDGQTADKVFAIAPISVSTPPVWNSSLTLQGFARAAYYEQKLPFTALTPSPGQSIVNIVGANLPSYLTIQTDGSTGYRWLRGTIPSTVPYLGFALQGVQSDGLTADKDFFVYPLETPPPVWTDSLSLANFTPGVAYEQQIPFSALTPAPGKAIVDIIAPALQSFLTIQPGGSTYKWLRGTFPAGSAGVSFTLRGVQSDGLTADKRFSISPVVVIPPPPPPAVAPVWNNSLILPSYTEGEYYNQALPFTALTPANGKSITNITGLNLPSYLTVRSVGDNRFLSGTIPAGSGNLTFTLQGVQSDSLTADKSFTIYAIATQPPVWNSSFTPPSFTAGQYYFQNVPTSALTAASGKQITNITGVTLPDYLSVLTDDSGYKYVAGTVPAGTASLSFTLQGIQTGGLTANRVFTIAATVVAVAPAWNGSLVPANYTTGQPYEQILPFSSLTPASGKSITNIVGVGLPSFLTIQTTSGIKYLRGTIPAGYTTFIFTLQGVQSDGQTANYSFQIYPITAQPPVWNGSFTPAGFTAGQPYDQAIPFSALTPAPGKSITNIVAVSLPNYLPLQTVSGVKRLIGTIPAGATSVSFTLQGVQSDGLTVNQAFTVYPISTPAIPPVWNNTLTFPAFTSGTYYEKQIPFSSLTPGGSATITDIQAVSMPSFLSVQPGGSGYVWLRGTVPVSGGYTQVSIALKGVQSDGLTADNTFTIQAVAVANRAPVLVNSVSSPLVAAYNTAFSFTWQSGDFSDPDGDALTWSVEYSNDGGSTYGALPSWASFTPSTRKFTGTSSTAGNAYFRRKVTDPGGLSAYNAFVLNTATQANRAPVVSNPNQFLFANQGAAFSFPMPTTTFTDPDGDTLSYTLQFSSNGGSTYGALPSWTSYNSTTKTWTGTPPVTSGSSVTYMFRIAASDGRGGSASDPFNLICAPQN